MGGPHENNEYQMRLSKYYLVNNRVLLMRETDLPFPGKY